MTPCERLGYKIGDAFVAPYSNDEVKTGDIIYLSNDDGSSLPYFTLDTHLDGKKYCFDVLKLNPHKPQTEAERRGAKFGVGGVIKETGERVIFQKEKGGDWFLFNEYDEDNLLYYPKNIRLDHEPEYKEIPFDEATHDQRMNVENLIYGRGNSKVSQVIQFNNGAYGITVEGMKNIFTHVQLFKVKVPA